MIWKENKSAKAAMGEVATWRYKGLWMLKINWLMENSAQAFACLFPSSYAPKKHIKKSGIVHYLITWHS